MVLVDINYSGQDNNNHYFLLYHSESKNETLIIVKPIHSSLGIYKEKKNQTGTLLFLLIVSVCLMKYYRTSFQLDRK